MTDKIILKNCTLRNITFQFLNKVNIRLPEWVSMISLNELYTKAITTLISLPKFLLESTVISLNDEPEKPAVSNLSTSFSSDMSLLNRFSSYYNQLINHNYKDLNISQKKNYFADNAEKYKIEEKNFQNRSPSDTADDMKNSARTDKILYFFFLKRQEITFKGTENKIPFDMVVTSSMFHKISNIKQLKNKDARCKRTSEIKADNISHETSESDSNNLFKLITLKMKSTSKLKNRMAVSTLPELPFQKYVNKFYNSFSTPFNWPKVLNVGNNDKKVIYLIENYGHTFSNNKFSHSVCIPSHSNCGIESSKVLFNFKLYPKFTRLHTAPAKSNVIRRFYGTLNPFYNGQDETDDFLKQTTLNDCMHSSDKAELAENIPIKKANNPALITELMSKKYEIQETDDDKINSCNHLPHNTTVKSKYPSHGSEKFDNENTSNSTSMGLLKSLVMSRDIMYQFNQITNFRKRLQNAAEYLRKCSTRKLETTQSASTLQGGRKDNEVNNKNKVISEYQKYTELKRDGEMTNFKSQKGVTEKEEFIKENTKNVFTKLNITGDSEFESGHKTTSYFQKNKWNDGKKDSNNPTSLDQEIMRKQTTEKQLSDDKNWNKVLADLNFESEGKCVPVPEDYEVNNFFNKTKHESDEESGNLNSLKLKSSDSFKEIKSENQETLNSCNERKPNKTSYENKNKISKFELKKADTKFNFYEKKFNNKISPTESKKELNVNPKSETGNSVYITQEGRYSVLKFPTKVEKSINFRPQMKEKKKVKYNFNETRPDSVHNNSEKIANKHTIENERKLLRLSVDNPETIKAKMMQSKNEMFDTVSDLQLSQNKNVTSSVESTNEQINVQEINDVKEPFSKLQPVSAPGLQPLKSSHTPVLNYKSNSLQQFNVGKSSPTLPTSTASKSQTSSSKLNWQIQKLAAENEHEKQTPTTNPKDFYSSNIKNDHLKEGGTVDSQYLNYFKNRFQKKTK